jgi:hypothetical protein
MATHSTSTPDHGHSLHDLERGNHQEDAIDFGAIYKVGVGLAVVTIVSYAIVLGVYKILISTNAEASAVRRYPMSVGQEHRLPPEPRLQTDPKKDLKDLRAIEADTLDHYGWVDKGASVVRIPIENAMKLTLERGLPSRSSNGSPVAATPAAAAPAENSPRQEPAK